MFDSELIKRAVEVASHWHRHGFTNVANMLAAGWKGEPYKTVCRERADGVGGDYFMVWPGGECPQYGRGLIDEKAEEAFELMAEEANRQKEEKAAAKAAAEAEAKAAARAKEKAAALASIERFRHKTGRDARADLALAFERLAACSE